MNVEEIERTIKGKRFIKAGNVSEMCLSGRFSTLCDSRVQRRRKCSLGKHCGCVVLMASKGWRSHPAGTAP